jgi:hypothetical protein
MTDLTPAEAPDSPAAISRASVVAFFIADHVALAPDAKLYVNGGFFSLLRFPSFPAMLPSLGIGAVLEIPFHDMMRDHMVRIYLRGPEDQELPVRVEVNFRSIPGLEMKFGEPGLVPFGTTIANVEFPMAGAYQLVLSLDDTEMQTYRFRAVQTPMVMSAGLVQQPDK